MKTYAWCSFANQSGFIGACVIEAPDAAAALKRADELGIAPKDEGDECVSVPFTIDGELPAELLDHMRTTLEGANELDRLIQPYVTGGAAT